MFLLYSLRKGIAFDDEAWLVVFSHGDFKPLSMKRIPDLHVTDA